MTVKAVNIEPGLNPSDKNNYFATVKFTGKTKLYGRFVSYANQPLLGRSVWFYPDEKSRKLVPRLNLDNTAEPWFVFDDYESASKMLNPPESEGSATIIIDNYIINYSLEVVHTARLVEVVKKTLDSFTPETPEVTEQSTGPEGTEDTAANNSGNLPAADNLFDAEEYGQGDTILGLKIEKINITDNPDKSSVDKYWATVRFSGKVEITGSFKINQGDEFLGDSISFKPDDISDLKLPKLLHDSRYTWFVFENTDAVKQALSFNGAEGFATVIIDNYTINYSPSDAYNTAIFIDIIARG